MLKCKAGKLVDVMWPFVKADIPIFVHGWTGIGKTEMVSGPLMRKVRDEYGEDAVLHDYRFSSKEPVDGTGIPIVDKEGRATIWTRPAFVPYDDGKMHIFYLGEIGHASVPMQHIAYQFVRERRLGEYDLPKRNRIILDLNTREDKGGDTKLVKPLENRGAHVYVEVDVNGWSDWAKENGVPGPLVAFHKLRPELLHKMDPNNPAYPTPRSVVDLAKLFPKRKDLVHMTSEEMTVISNGAIALCGEGYAMQLMTFIKHVSAGLSSLKDIKANPTKAKVPEDVHLQYVIASALSHHLIDAKENAKDEVEWCVKYAKRLAPDIASTMAHNAMQGNDSLSSVKMLKELILD